MKKLIWMLPLLLMLCACGKADAPENSAQLRPLQDRSLPQLTEAESYQMLRCMTQSRALVHGPRLYCLDYDGDYLPVLAEYSLDGGLRRNAILAENCVPVCLSLGGGRLYYLNERENYALESLALDGSERRTLREGPCGWLTLRGEALYFCDAEGRYCRTDLEGKGEERLLDTPCAYPWLLEEAVIYQSLEDGRLHLRSFSAEGEEADACLTQTQAAAPLLWGDKLYYSAGEELWSMGLDGLGAARYAVPALVYPAELLPEGGALRLRGISREGTLRQWIAWPEDAAGTLQYLSERGYFLCDYADAQHRIDTVYNPDGRVRCFLFIDADGRETVYIGGRVSGAETEQTDG